MTQTERDTTRAKIIFKKVSKVTKLRLKLETSKYQTLRKKEKTMLCNINKYTNLVMYALKSSINQLIKHKQVLTRTSGFRES